MNIYVGNLPFTVKSGDLEKLFAGFGTVTSAKVIEDNFTGKSRGFGFVEMASKDEGLNAINDLNGKDFEGRTLTVNEARPKSEGGGGGGGGNRRNGGGGDRDRRW